MPYIRQRLFDSLWTSLHGPAHFLQVVTGPRQVGKTTLALQIYNRWKGPKHYESADQPHTPDPEWIMAQWETARKLSEKSSHKDTLIILDEIQKIPRWSEVIKRLSDEDRRRKRHIRAVLLGSSALLVQRGLTESLAGRYELHRHPHWSYSECHEYFRLSLENYLVFGGYPGAIPLQNDFERWKRYIRDSIVESVIGKDVLVLSPVQKPALLRQAFGMACSHPAEILSYQKMLGQLHEAGNTTTIAHYFHLLSAAFLLAPLPSWSGNRLRQRGSIPKIILRDNSLITAVGLTGFNGRNVSPALAGRLVENAVGAALATVAEKEGGQLFYWRDRQEEIDFVLQTGQTLIGIEVKSGTAPPMPSGMVSFKKRYPNAKMALVSRERMTRASKEIFHLSLRKFLLDPYSLLT